MITSCKAGSAARHYGVDGCVPGYIIDQETDLLDEATTRLAGIFNACGFDMVYFDGGEDVEGEGGDEVIGGEGAVVGFDAGDAAVVTNAAAGQPLCSSLVRLPERLLLLVSYDDLAARVRGIPLYQLFAPVAGHAPRLTFATDITSASANPCPAPCTDAAGKPLDLRYDAALCWIDVDNDIVPYDGGAYFFTAGKSRRRGAELAVAAATLMLGDRTQGILRQKSGMRARSASPMPVVPMTMAIFRSRQRQ